MSAYSFNNHLGTPSCPVAFLGLSLFKAEKRRASKGLAVRNLHCVTGEIQAFGGTPLVVGMQSWFFWKSLSAQTEECNPRSVSWQTRSLSLERGQCQRSALSGSILKRSSRYGELYACNWPHHGSVEKAECPRTNLSVGEDLWDVWMQVTPMEGGGGAYWHGL